MVIDLCDSESESELEIVGSNVQNKEKTGFSTNNSIIYITTSATAHFLQNLNNKKVDANNKIHSNQSTGETNIIKSTHSLNGLLVEKVLCNSSSSSSSEIDATLSTSPSPSETTTKVKKKKEVRKIEA